MLRRVPSPLIWSCTATLLAAGCTGDAPPPPSAARATAPGEASVAPAAAPQAPLVIFLGDSLTAGFGLAEEDAYPARAGEALAARGVVARVVNAGVSGDTTAGGLARLDWLLRQRPDVLVVALGANDGLRGIELADTEANLRRIVTRAQAAGAQVILAGMLIPPNYGPDYSGRFAALFPALAGDLGVALVPFLLEGVAADPALNLADGLHPNAEGQRRVADNVLPFVLEALARVAGKGGEGDG